MTQLSSLLVNMLEQGALFGFLGLGVLITFRFFRVPDLTAEGSYPLGGAVAAALLVAHVNPILATAAAVLAGAAAGAVTAVVHTRFRINPIVAGIIVMTALYTVNLRVMGRANLSLLTARTLFDAASDLLAGVGLRLPDASVVIIVSVVLLAAAALALLWFLRTELGLAVRATGENPAMIGALGVDIDRAKLIGLAISNAAIALSGALVSQDHGFADIGMGTGILVTGAAAVMLGEALFGDRSLGLWITGTLLGVFLYRFLVALALRVGLDPVDLKLITAVLLLLSLYGPQLRRRRLA